MAAVSGDAGAAAVTEGRVDVLRSVRADPPNRFMQLEPCVYVTQEGYRLGAALPAAFAHAAEGRSMFVLQSRPSWRRAWSRLLRGSFVPGPVSLLAVTADRRVEAFGAMGTALPFAPAAFLFSDPPSESVLSRLRACAQAWAEGDEVHPCCLDENALVVVEVVNDDRERAIYSADAALLDDFVNTMVKSLSQARVRVEVYPQAAEYVLKAGLDGDF